MRTNLHLKKLVVGNWKMNPETQEQAVELIKSLERYLKDSEPNCENVICPPFVFLAECAKRRHNLKLGAQDVSFAAAGSMTGEISAGELADLGVEYVILGHSERRMYQGETDSVVNAKLIAALQHKLIPILCLGGEEGAIESEMKTLVTKQFVKCIHNVAAEDLKKIVYAYEPVWAISTMKNSKPASGEHARDVIEHIYQILERHMPAAKARKAKVLYGGTVNKDNVSLYARYPEISGALVGAASLNADNFYEIIKEFERESIHR